MDVVKKRRRLSSAQIIILGFLGVILIGSILLMLPCSVRGDSTASFADALFTATSAVCVTGLIVQDTATYWSSFGHAVILMMIQIGGMGVVTIAIFIVRFSGKKIGLMQRNTMAEAISAPQLGGIVRLTSFVITCAVLIELMGAMLMAPVLCREFGLGKGIWYSVFHSVSAFCNAGFDLMGVKEPFSSLTSYSAHPLINGVIMLLIVMGGIGFLTWDDIRKHRFHFLRYRMQSKVILTVTAALILFPALYFYFSEFGRSAWGELSVGERVLDSLFQSVTLRTAGFNTVNLDELTEAGKTISIILMIIGGSPGSTAGGLKTTTAAVLLGTVVCVFFRRKQIHFFHRRVEEDTVNYAVTLLVMYMLLFIGGGIVISRLENLPILTCMFETASAVGTVGLTLGITPQLGLISRLILIVLMFFGRAGVLTIVYAAVAEKSANGSKYPQEKITIG